MGQRYCRPGKSSLGNPCAVSVTRLQMKLPVTGFFIWLRERVDKPNIPESRYSRPRGVVVPAGAGRQNQIINVPGPQPGPIVCLHSVVSCKICLSGQNDVQPAKIFIIDDHPLVRNGLRMLIESEADLGVCCETDRIEGAMELIAKYSPDLAIIDLSLPDGNGIDLINRIKCQHPDIRVLVSSMHDESLFAERVLRTGAQGYINKQEAGDQVIEAIRQILRGEIYLSEAMQQHLSLQAAGGEQVTPKSSVELLSNRELQIFELIGQGMGTSRIADKLNLSVKTIETHRARIKKKLGLGSSTELMRSAVKWCIEAH